MRRLKKPILRIILALAILLCGLIAYVEFTHRYNYGHFVHYGLHIDVVSKDSDIGIPGQTKMYHAELSNFTLWPAKLTACNYVTDAFDHGTDYPYAVQRWDARSNNWQTVVEEDVESFCQPYPLGKIQTQVVSKTLWPGMSVQVMEGEATGAREPFRKGDLARFVVFRRIDKQADWQRAIPSVAFTIEDDVERNEGGTFRVAH